MWSEIESVLGVVVAAENENLDSSVGDLFNVDSSSYELVSY